MIRTYFEIKTPCHSTLHRVLEKHVHAARNYSRSQCLLKTKIKRSMILSFNSDFLSELTD